MMDIIWILLKMEYEHEDEYKLFYTIVSILEQGFFSLGWFIWHIMLNHMFYG